jgi:hypothetical protein
MQQHFPMFTVTPYGIMMDGAPLSKSVSQGLSPETLRSIKRIDELLAKVKPGDWDNRTSHATNNVPILAQAQMIAALASPQPYPPLHKQSRQELAKDINTDFNADEEDNSGYDGYDTSDDGSNSGDDSGDNGDFNAEHPRWPAGDQEGRGGEFRPKDEDADTGEYQVAQRTDAATDAGLPTLRRVLRCIPEPINDKQS